jgi:hypothetical protein
MLLSLQRLLKPFILKGYVKNYLKLIVFYFMLKKNEVIGNVMHNYYPILCN